MFKCMNCGYRGPDVAHSPRFKRFLCDKCYDKAHETNKSNATTELLNPADHPD